MRKELYKETDCGARGKTFERDLKVLFRLADIVSAPGHVDLRRRYKNHELKTNSGELGDVGGKLIKGCSLVVYVPVVNMDLPVEKQEGFLIDRAVFLEILEELELTRTKKSTSGKMKVTIQTIWNYKQNKPHSLKKYNALLDALYERCEMTLEEWIEMSLGEWVRF